MRLRWTTTCEDGLLALPALFFSICGPLLLLLLVLLTLLSGDAHFYLVPM